MFNVKMVRRGSENLLTRKRICAINLVVKDKSVHNEIKDFYAHMSLTYERRSARRFCHYSGNIVTIFPT